MRKFLITTKDTKDPKTSFTMICFVVFVTFVVANFGRDWCGGWRDV